MLSIPLYDAQGTPAGDVQIDPKILGGRVRPKLLKQAIVAYQANGRQNTSATRSRGMVVGSTRKLRRQKGTGSARVGTRRTNIRRGGGVAFAKGDQVFKQGLNRKMRRLARDNAILAKARCNDVAVVVDFSFDSPSTKRFVSLLEAVGAQRGCVVALGDYDDIVYRSGRNIPKTEIRPLSQVSAYDVLRRKKLILTRTAFEALTGGPDRPGAAPQEEG